MRKDPFTDELREAAMADMPRLAPGAPFLRSRLLDVLLTRAHPFLPLVLYLPPAVYLVFRAIDEGAGAAGLVGGVLGGVALWTLCEYLLHRFFLHFPIRGPRSQLFAFLVHGHHHACPEDRYRLVAPPLQSASLMLLVLGPLAATTAAPVWMPIAVGFFCGYIAYESIHYAIHHARFVPRPIRGHHLRHHHGQRGAGAGFGISSPLWDWILGSAGSR